MKVFDLCELNDHVEQIPICSITGNYGMVAGKRTISGTIYEPGAWELEVGGQYPMLQTQECRLYNVLITAADSSGAASFICDYYEEGEPVPERFIDWTPNNFLEKMAEEYAREHGHGQRTSP